jgi:hypothetical protein
VPQNPPRTKPPKRVPQTAKHDGQVQKRGRGGQRFHPPVNTTPTG